MTDKIIVTAGALAALFWCIGFIGALLTFYSGQLHWLLFFMIPSVGCVGIAILTMAFDELRNTW